MACAGSQVKDTVMAKRVPHVTLSTRWRFSEPEEKKETRPEGGRSERDVLGQSRGTWFQGTVQHFGRSAHVASFQRLREEDCLITFALRVEPKSGRGWYLLAISYYTKVQKYAYQAPEFYTKHRLDQHKDCEQEKNQP